MNSMTGSGGFGPMTGQGMKVPRGYDLVNNYTPEQQNVFQSQFQHMGPNSYMSRLAGGDQGIFDEIEAPDLRQFAGIQGNIASRFSGAGMGGRKSSGFQNTMTAAGSNFAQELAGRRHELQRNAIKDLMGMSNTLLGQQPYSLQEKQKPWWQQLLMGIGENSGSLIDSGAKMYMGGF